MTIPLVAFTDSQVDLMDAIELFVAANNRFIDYYDAVSSEFTAPGLHPAEEAALAFLQGFTHLHRLAHNNGMSTDQLLKPFKVYKTSRPARLR